MEVTILRSTYSGSFLCWKSCAVEELGYEIEDEEEKEEKTDEGIVYDGTDIGEYEEMFMIGCG